MTTNTTDVRSRAAKKAWLKLTPEEAEAQKDRMRRARQEAFAKRRGLTLEEYLALPRSRHNGAVIYPEKKAAPPRTCPPETAGRILIALMQDYYDTDNRRYLDDWSDQKVAEALNVPRAWVTNERQKFGEDRNEQPAYVEQILSELRTLSEQQTKLFAEAAQAISDLTKRVEEAAAAGEAKRLELEKRLNKALGK